MPSSKSGPGAEGVSALVHVPEPDDAAAGATDLGDITQTYAAQFPRDSLDGSADPRDYYRFEITETRSVRIGLRQLDRDAHVYLEDQNQNVLASSENAWLANEWIAHDLQPGTYFVRVEAVQGGDNHYVFRYGVGRP